MNYLIMFNLDKLLTKKEEIKNEHEMSVKDVLKGRVGRHINITRANDRNNIMMGTLEKSTIDESGYLPKEYRVNIGTEEKPEYIDFAANDVENLRWPDPNRPRKGKGGIPRPTFDLK